MRKLLFVSFLSILLSSCTGLKELPLVAECQAIELTTGDDFYELISDDYQLTSLRQEGDCVELKIQFQGKLESIKLHWAGDISNRMPPQANVNLILKTDQSKRKYLATYRFDMSQITASKDKTWIYFLDDEGSILMEK